MLLTCWGCALPNAQDNGSVRSIRYGSRILQATNPALIVVVPGFPLGNAPRCHEMTGYSPCQGEGELVESSGRVFWMCPSLLQMLPSFQASVADRPDYTSVPAQAGQQLSPLQGRQVAPH